jgi:glycosyltransferase involved in cell wall biosynthesis
MKIVLANPGVGPFVQQTALALIEADLLASYWTTFADQPEARWRKIVVKLSSVLGFDIERELKRRAVQEVPATFLRRMPFWEVARSLMSKIGMDPRLVDSIWEYEMLSFDHRVAERGLEKANGIYGYEYSTLASFERAEKNGLARIYEVPSPEHDFVENLIQHEIQQFPELNDGKRRYFLARQQRRTERRRREWALADVVIINSNFTRASYAAAGLDVTKVRVVPLGAPPTCSTSLEFDRTESDPLRVLWVGTFSIRKGAHYLLSAWRQLAPKNALLQIFGANTLPAKLTSHLPTSVKISPTVPRAELFEHYRTADVLVFPTLCDGFGMVVTEAFAHGLPVITTNRAGASDLVRDKENGLIVPAGNASAVTEALEWCLIHRAELRFMRRAALETAASWQWHDFRRALSRNVIDGLRSSGYSTRLSNVI